MAGAANPSDKRDFDASRFDCSIALSGSNVVLVDDSWATGGNAFSAGAALKRAGAGQVHAVVLGRLLNPAAWKPAAEFIEHGGLGLGFVPARSPWITLT